MLRTLQSNNYQPKLYATKFDTQAETILENSAILNGTIPTHSSGETIITLNKTFPRQVVPVVGAHVTNRTAGGVVGVEQDSTATTGTLFRVSSLLSGGGSDPGAMYAMIAAFNSSDTNACSLQAVKTNILKPRLLAFSVDGTGTASITRGVGQATLTDGGTGVYTLTYDRAFADDGPMICVLSKGTGMAAHTISSSVDSCTIKFYDENDAAVDADFDVVILGNDSPGLEMNYEFQRAIQVPWRKPRMMAFTVDGAGTPVLTIGSEFATITDIGTGNYSIDLKAAYQFAAVPVCIGCANSSNARLQQTSPSTKSSIEVTVSNAAGSAVADDGFNLIMFGSDDATDY